MIDVKYCPGRIEPIMCSSWESKHSISVGSILLQNEFTLWFGIENWKFEHNYKQLPVGILNNFDVYCTLHCNNTQNCQVHSVNEKTYSTIEMNFDGCIRYRIPTKLIGNWYINRSSQNQWVNLSAINTKTRHFLCFCLFVSSLPTTLAESPNGLDDFHWSCSCAMTTFFFFFFSSKLPSSKFLFYHFSSSFC